MYGFARRAFIIKEEHNIEGNESFGNAIGYTRQTIGDWIKADTITVKGAKAIAKRFGYNWRWIHKGAGDKHMEEKGAKDNDLFERVMLRLRLYSEVSQLVYWEIDLINDTFTYQKQLIEHNAQPNESETIPLDNLFNLIDPGDHARVRQAISDAIHNMDGHLISVSYTLLTPAPIKRNSWARTLFDDLTRPTHIVGISTEADRAVDVQGRFLFKQ